MMQQAQTLESDLVLNPACVTSTSSLLMDKLVNGSVNY